MINGIPKEMVSKFKIILLELQNADLQEQLDCAESRNFYTGGKTTPNPHPKPGFVYILKADNGAYKIGQTKNIRGRIESIDGTLPYDTELIHTIETENCKKAEKYFHQEFADKRIRGEWFQLTEEDIEQLKQISKYPIREEDI